MQDSVYELSRYINALMVLYVWRCAANIFVYLLSVSRIVTRHMSADEPTSEKANHMSQFYCIVTLHVFMRRIVCLKYLIQCIDFVWYKLVFDIKFCSKTAHLCRTFHGRRPDTYSGFFLFVSCPCINKSVCYYYNVCILFGTPAPVPPAKRVVFWLCGTLVIGWAIVSSDNDSATVWLLNIVICCSVHAANVDLTAVIDIRDNFSFSMRLHSFVYRYNNQDAKTRPDLLLNIFWLLPFSKL